MVFIQNYYNTILVYQFKNGYLKNIYKFNTLILFFIRFLCVPSLKIKNLIYTKTLIYVSHDVLNIESRIYYKIWT